MSYKNLRKKKQLPEGPKISRNEVSLFQKFPFSMAFAQLLYKPLTSAGIIIVAVRLRVNRIFGLWWPKVEIELYRSTGEWPSTHLERQA